jgi:hypothetical protein
LRANDHQSTNQPTFAYYIDEDDLAVKATTTIGLQRAINFLNIIVMSEA